MQENRSFDSYFGTYPGADGIPKHVCVPDPRHARCQRPYHDHRAVNFGGPHDHRDAVKDVNAGAMNGFIGQAEVGRRTWCNKHINAPACSLSPKAPDVMGYHDWHEIPNYWSYARHFVLQDHMFQADASWSLPGHLYMVSGWSAKCSQAGNPMSCVSAVQAPGSPPGEPQNKTGAVPDYALDRSDVSPPPRQRELGLLRLQRDAARLREQRDVLQGAAAERKDAGHLEPAAVVRDSRARPASARTSRRSTTSCRPHAPARCPRSPGSHRPTL